MAERGRRLTCIPVTAQVRRSGLARIDDRPRRVPAGRAALARTAAAASVTRRRTAGEAASGTGPRGTVRAPMDGFLPGIVLAESRARASGDRACLLADGSLGCSEATPGGGDHRVAAARAVRGHRHARPAPWHPRAVRPMGASPGTGARRQVREFLGRLMARAHARFAGHPGPRLVANTPGIGRSRRSTGSGSVRRGGTAARPFGEREGGVSTGCKRRRAATRAMSPSAMTAPPTAGPPQGRTALGSLPPEPSRHHGTVDTGGPDLERQAAALSRSARAPGVPARKVRFRPPALAS